jgi:hypothetical protein
MALREVLEITCDRCLVSRRYDSGEMPNLEDYAKVWPAAISTFDGYYPTDAVQDQVQLVCSGCLTEDERAEHATRNRDLETLRSGGDDVPF